jgi:hypothetical protein
MRRRSRSIVIALVVAALTCAGPAALAAWNFSGDGNGRSRAISMPAGSTPTASVSNRNVQVTWAAVTMPDGGAVDSYLVKRYNTSGAEESINGACDVVISTTTCTESTVPPGTWRYAVAPRLGSWQGPFGPASADVSVAAPTLTLNNPTTITQFPSQLTGAIASFIPGQSVTVRLDDPTSGTVLPSSFVPTTVAADGAANLTVTISSAVTNGTHSLYAIGNNGDLASATFTVNVPALTLAPELLDGSTQPGRIQENDLIRVTYSEPLSVSSLCNGQTDDSQPFTVPGIVRITDDNGSSGHDLLIVESASCSGGLKFGSISLGSSEFVSFTQEFDAAITYDPTTQRVTVVLGARITGGQQPVKVSQSVTVTYTPQAGLTAANGSPITGTGSSTGVQF